MAITVNLRYTGKKGAAQAFAREMISSGTILLIDSWENQQAIDQHHATSMMKTITELREKYDLHMTIERFVSDDNIPEQDKAFIRN